MREDGYIKFQWMDECSHTYMIMENAVIMNAHCINHFPLSNYIERLGFIITKYEKQIIFYIRYKRTFIKRGK